MTSEFKKLAYGVAFFAAARRVMQERYLQSGGGTEKEELVADMLPYGDRVIPEDVIVENLQRLQEEEVRLLNELQNYEFRKREQQPAIPQVKVEEVIAVEPEKPAVPAPKPGRKTRLA